MSDSESVDYLQPGFDPASLTNPRLRSILVTYNVHYPSNAKKPELVELFNDHVAPQASKILARRARAKRSSMGIIDVQPSSSYSQSTTAYGGDSFSEDQPPVSPRKRRAGRPSSHAATPHPDEQQQQQQQQQEEEEDREENARRTQRRSSPRKRSSRASSFQPPDALGTSDTDTFAAPRPPSRRARAKTPQVKLEPTEEERYVATPVAARPASRYAGSNHHNTRLSSVDDDDTVFTHDNPFQSGSSPTTGSSPAQRRRTSGHDEPASTTRASTGTLSSGSRKREAGSRVVSSPAVDASYDSPPIRGALQRQVSPFAARMPEPEVDEEEEEEEEDEEQEEDYQEDYDPLAPGEEFTPEEQLELTQEEDVQRKQNASYGRRGKNSKAGTRRRSVVSALATPLWVLLLTLLGIYAAWYRQEKRAVGFCGVGRLAVPLLSEQIEKLEWLPDWVHDIEIPDRLQVFIEPQCEPCPSHAFCYSDFTVRCENGYIEKAHPLSLGGLVPLPPTCEPDGERARRVKAVADKAIEELRDRRAKWESGDLADEDGQVPDDPAIDVPVLKEVISEKRSKKMSKEEFDDLWMAAIGDIENRDEVESEPGPTYAATDPETIPNARLSSTSLARLPLTCAIRRSIRLGLARYRFPLSVLILSFGAVVYARARFRARRATLARVPALVDLVLERLAAQKELWLYEDDMEGGGDQQQNADDSSFLPDPFLFLPQLRDDVLRTTHSLAARERIWKHVRAVVEQNSNVRTGQREGRNGEVGRAWEWIGPVGNALNVIAGSSAAGGAAVSTPLEMSAVRRRRSGRASLMPTGSGASSRAGSTAPRDSLPSSRPSEGGDGIATNEQQPDAAGAGGENRSALHKRWKESRPIF